MHFIFEEMRWTHVDLYTAGPLESLGKEELIRLAEEVGMTVAELRHHLATPHVEMTCPLCGRLSTHLVGCKGCGSDAWSWEFEEAHGKEARGQLRQRLREFLVLADGVRPDQIEHAVQHAFTWGGCMVCAECWRNTLPHDAYLSCPFNLLADRQLRPGHLLQGLLIHVAHLKLREEHEAAVQSWLESIWQHWTEIWNTVPAGPEREAVREWRGALLHAALMTKLPQLDINRSNDVRDKGDWRE